MSTSVTHQGITWTWTPDRPVGAFANGEPYVVGSISVTSISPGWTGTHNGSEKNFSVATNASTGQGFTAASTATPFQYVAGLNAAAALPIALAPGDFLASSLTGGSTPSTGNRTWMDKVVVLTVLASAPPANSFRPPPYQGADRNVQWTTADMNLSFLPSLAAPSATPSWAEIQSTIPALPWFEVTNTWKTSESNPWANSASPKGSTWSVYGREVAYKWGKIALWLCTAQSASDKQQVAIATVQAGIDIWGFLAGGGSFYHDGGHKCGRKFPLVFAAQALNSNTLKTVAGNASLFQDDQQTWLVAQSDVGRLLNADKVEYLQEDVGKYEWGIRHRFEPGEDDRRWTGISPSNSEGLPSGGTPYRTAQNGSYWQTTAIELMGLTNIWNHAPIFNYAARYRTHYGLGNTFAEQMWQYKDGGTPPPTVVAQVEFSPVGGNFTTAQTVALSTPTAGATIRWRDDGINPTSSTGTVYSGPIAVSVNKTIKAIAYKAGSVDSPVTEATYTFADYQTAEDTAFPLLNIGLGSTYTTIAEIEFDVVPSETNMDGLVGLSSGEAQGPSGIACIVRFNDVGNIDARNGGNYSSAIMSYTAGVSYHVRIAASLTTKTYNAWVTPEGGSEVQVATNFAFRTEQAGVSSLNTFVASSPSGFLSISDLISMPDDPPAVAPSFSPASGNYSTAPSITFSTSTPSPTMRYTLTTDDSEPPDPTVSSTAYSGAITPVAGATTRIKARTFADGFAQSPITAGAWTVDAVEVPPEILDAVEVDNIGGQYDGPTVDVTPTNIASGATAHYEVGTIGQTADPTTLSTAYVSGAITITPPQSLKIFQVKDGATDSQIAEYNYTLTGFTPPPDSVPVTPGPVFTTISLPVSFSSRVTLLDHLTIFNAGTEFIGGMSAGTPATDGDLSAAYRISGGVFQALNGSTWSAENALAVEVGEYEVRFSLKPTTFSLQMRLVDTPENAWTVIASDYARSNHGAVDRVAYRAIAYPIAVEQHQRNVVRIIVLP